MTFIAEVRQHGSCEEKWDVVHSSERHPTGNQPDCSGRVGKRCRQRPRRCHVGNARRSRPYAGTRPEQLQVAPVGRRHNGIRHDQARICRPEPRRNCRHHDLARFLYKRDRFARPEDAVEALQLEKKLAKAGITVVHSDGCSLPLKHGEQSLMRDMELLLAYSQNGEEIRKLAERVLGFQRMLAEQGYRVGGNAPYGFVRALVNAKGEILEELPRGKTVRQAGCHVRVFPKDFEKIANWVQILAWKEQGWGIKRIARELNDRGIPSPDAGRTRTDHGVKHRVSGKWTPNTVAELCRNPLICGVSEYGKRSEGKIRRLGKECPRLLDEQTDLTIEGTPRVIINDHSLRTRRAVGENRAAPPPPPPPPPPPLEERSNGEQVQLQMDKRGKSQRGVRRAKDPARYPLACRLVDLTDNCGSILYGRTNQGRPVYTCGRYLRTSGGECESNQVDAEAMLRFVIKTLQQSILSEGSRDRLRRKLLDRARKRLASSNDDPARLELSRQQARLAELVSQKDTIEYRMSRERDDEFYAVHSKQFRSICTQLTEAEEAIARLHASKTAIIASSPETVADAAITLLDDATRIMDSPKARDQS